MINKRKGTFRCALCEEEFPLPPEDVWNEQMAIEEHNRLYPNLEYNPAKVAITCDHCHNLVQEWRLYNEGHKTIQ